MNGYFNQSENTAKDMYLLMVQKKQNAPNNEIWDKESIKRKYLHAK